MAAKNTLKYKRKRLPPLLDIVDELLEKCLHAIQSPNFKATIADLVKLIRLRMNLEPVQPSPVTVRWLDRLNQAEKLRFEPTDSGMP